MGGGGKNMISNYLNHNTTATKPGKPGTQCSDENAVSSLLSPYIELRWQFSRVKIGTGKNGMTVISNPNYNV